MCVQSSATALPASAAFCNEWTQCAETALRQWLIWRCTSNRRGPRGFLSLSFATQIDLPLAPTQALSIALSLYHWLLIERIQCFCIGRRISVRKTIERESDASLNIAPFQSINWNWPHGTFITLSGFRLVLDIQPDLGTAFRYIYIYIRVHIYFQ